VATAETTWAGAAELRALLVPLEELRPHPRNPRRGDVAAIRESLRRFGQQRPILALADGTIVAGNHTFHAVRAEGWTHAAVVRSELEGREVEAYLLADNRVGDLAVFDDLALGELLGDFYKLDDLAGLGYSREDVTRLLAELGSWTGPLDEFGVRLDQLGTRTEGGRSFTLEYAEEEADEFERLVAERAGEYGTRSLPATVLEALRRGGA
jgi:hypothetical protein